MIPYSIARNNMRTGDVLLVKATGLISRIIRSLTGESYNHVAMIIEKDEGVFVVEMKEFKGWQMMPASQWMDKYKKKEVSWGKAPAGVRDSVCAEDNALSHRGRKYSYWTLVTVWLTQFTKRSAPGNLVCSTFVQTVWQECGYVMFNKLADPGDFPAHLNDVNLILKD